jgi:hypothetical protein
MLSRIDSGFHNVFGREGEGFRMPASGDLSARTEAGVRKPPRKEPAGAAWAVVVYGDLTGRRFGQGTRWPA